MLTNYFYSIYFAITKPSAYCEALKWAEEFSAAELDSHIQTTKLTIAKLMARAKLLSSHKDSIVSSSLLARRCHLAAYQKVRSQKNK